MRRYLNSLDKKGMYVLNGIRDRKEITRQFRKVADRAGLKEFTFHNLRDNYASHLAMRDVPILIIQKMLGHKSIKTTMVYAHLPSTATINLGKYFD